MENRLIIYIMKLFLLHQHQYQQGDEKSKKDSKIITVPPSSRRGIETNYKIPLGT